jgi:hypothetical protein
MPADHDVNTEELISRIEGMGYEWGVSDGN